jgi:endo-1,4-beta-xylanase
MMLKLTRRQFAAAALATRTPLRGKPAAEKITPAGTQIPLRDIAADRHILFGTMITLSEIADPDYARLVADECAIVAPGIEAKWPITEPREGDFRFAAMDALAGFAAGAQLRLHMVNLIWSNGLPQWTLQALAQGRGRAVMARHIHAVAGRYRGRVHSWDVVNEAVDPHWTSDKFGLVMTPWWHGMGDDFIACAFADAASADPSASLMINDDDLEYDAPEREAKRAAYLRLIEYWLRHGVPIHAFGLETHLKPWLPLAEKSYRRFLHDIAGFGLKLRITEFDVNDRALPADIPLRDRMAADAAKRFLDVALDEPAVDTLITWGLSDRTTWLRNELTARRPDGLAPRPLPYDAHFAAKPLREAIAAALSHAPSRPA